jgi:AraC family transcriptional regulator
LSEFHFSRLFKKTIGFSPSQYLIRRRIARARRLLRETTRSMIEIGLEVGYSSPSHFAQIFRREVGVTPTEYRGSE